MKKLILFIYLLSLSIFCFGQESKKTENEITIGVLSGKATLLLTKSSENRWGMNIINAGLSSISQPKPVMIEVYKDSLHIIRKFSGYESIVKSAYGFSGKAHITVDSADFLITDQWTIVDSNLQFSRKVTVNGNIKGAGFLSALRLTNTQKQSKAETKFFAPGMIYGSTAHLTEVGIGGKKSGNATLIREDRLPAPMFGLYYKDGSSITILNPNPQGVTTAEDSHDTQIKTLIDERFLFGAPGVEETNGNLHFGYAWPGTEGSTTYQGNTYPGGQIVKWRRRYHPVKQGFQQSYGQILQIKSHKDFATYYTNAWRWGWSVLKPALNPQDIELARRDLIDMLGEQIKNKKGLYGIPNFIVADPLKTDKPDEKTIMGFTGKALESANFLLQDADRKQSPFDEKHRQEALQIISSFIKVVKLSPPNGEGFNMLTGKPALAIPHEKKVYLRSFGDDLKALLKAYKREKAKGITHDDWLNWAKSFADWLLPQQNANGGFPRAWQPASGKILDASPQSSYTVIPYLLLLSELTNNERYKLSAIKVGEFCWANGQADGVFVGGTIDNPDVIDKEAGTLSLEAYLALFYTTHENKWLIRAKAAAAFAETWMYIWNVPMPVDENEQSLEWKRGIPTVGLQLISSGHSLTDLYMSFDTDEFARLFKLTGDSHYFDVSAILLHNTKSMLALKGRIYDLKGPGWQQEHWSLAPIRGFGLHRGWLPWVSTSHLNGIFELEEFDPVLFEKMKGLK